MNTEREWFIQHEAHTDEEGWYGYKIPTDPKCKAIRYVGPLTKRLAEEWLERQKSK